MGSFTEAKSAHGPYRRRAGRDRRGLSGLDIGGLVIMLALLVSGLIPVIGGLVSGDVTTGSTHLGFVVVLGSALLIARELWLARRSQIDRSATESRDAPVDRTENQDD